MKTKKQKGFTLVELVIVIAVIAILAAVLIPTFSSLVKKANESADIQAARQMNTHLALEAATEDMTITNVYEALLEGGMTAKDYHPLIKDRFYFWDSKLNRVIYTDENYNVLYPEDYKDQTSKDNWYSLSGVINETEVEVKSGTATIETAEELYWLSNNFETAGATTITLTKDINAMGADIAFEFTEVGTYTIGGADDKPVTITGLVQTTSKFTETDAKQDGYGKKYASGLISVVGEEEANSSLDVKVSIKNIIVKDAVIGDLETGGVGAIVGRIDKNADVTIEKCQVLNSIINGRNKVGALVGSVGASKIKIENCKVDECTVNSSEGEAGMAIGCLYGNKGATIDKKFKDWVTNTTLNLVDGGYSRTKYENVTITYTQKDNAAASSTIENVTLVSELSNKGIQQTGQDKDKNKNDYLNMRMFKSSSYMSALSRITGTITFSDGSTYSYPAHANTEDIIKYENTEYNTKVLYFFEQ